MATLRSPTPRFGPPPHFGGPRFGGPEHGFLPRGPASDRFGERLGFNFRPSMPGQGSTVFDGKKLRTKPMIRRTVDYNSSFTNFIKNRVWEKDHRNSAAVQPDALYATHVTPPASQLNHPMNCVCTKYVRNASNKIKCPIFCVVWTPEGRRLITGASSGEFTLWNGMTFNFETILQAHDTSVRAMVWNHSGQWMVTGEHGGFVKYWQINMNNVKMYQAHKDAVRGISFCPTDSKYATCSDDGTVRVWDFLRCTEERILRGHGADVKCVDWHPQKGLVASGSRDSQQPIILWDPRMGSKLSTIHAHKSTVMEVKWNSNGSWLLTASRDHLIKLFDVRNMKEEVQSFKGHRKEATTIAWNPVHESLFASGGSDGQILYWLVGQEREVGAINEAHETMVWSLAWHPMGHILVSGSNDHSSKFWTRNRPGDGMRDRYNLNLLPQGVTDDMLEYDDLSAGASIPGMGMEYMPHSEEKEKSQNTPAVKTHIPGLDFSVGDAPEEESKEKKKKPFAKPVPNDFQKAWSEGKQPESMTMHLENDEGMNKNKPVSLLDIKTEPVSSRDSGHGFRRQGIGDRDQNQGQGYGGRSRMMQQPKVKAEKEGELAEKEEMEGAILPGMGGPLPGPDHEPTLPPSRTRFLGDRPLTSAAPPLMDRPVMPTGGLLGDRPSDPQFSQQERQNWEKGQNDWSSDHSHNALQSSMSSRSSEYGNNSFKRRSYDSPHNTSTDDVFYEKSRGFGSDVNNESHYSDRTRQNSNRSQDSFGAGFSTPRNDEYGSFVRKGRSENNPEYDSYNQRGGRGRGIGDRGRGRGGNRGRGGERGMGRGREPPPPLMSQKRPYDEGPGQGNGHREESGRSRGGGFGRGLPPRGRGLARGRGSWGRL